MTKPIGELPEEVARELRDLLRDNIPSCAVTIQQLVDGDENGRGETVWRRVMRKKIADGEWARKKRGNSYYYWPIGGKNERD